MFDKNIYEPIPVHQPLPRSSMPTQFTGEPIETIYDTVYKDTDTSKKKKKPTAGQK